MSQALCPTCKTETKVVETRSIHDSLKRRRRCENNHKFVTVEVSADTPKRVVELVQWAVRNNITDNFEQYVTELLFGLPCQEQTEQPEELQQAA